MVALADIQRLANDIAKAFPEVESIILFGSHAYGNATPDSDVDLLVIQRHRGSGIEAAAAIRCAVDADFPLDIIVRTPDRMRDRLAEGDSFSREIQAKGIVLYEADDQTVDRQGRRRSRRRGSVAPLAQARPL